MSDTPRMPIKEFRERGYLHEVNRLLLHPVGLALEVRQVIDPHILIKLTSADLDLLDRIVDVLGETLHDRLTPELRQQGVELLERVRHAEEYEAGDETLGGVWDQREHPEGVSYGEDLLSAEKAASVCAELLARREARKEQLDYVIQPVASDQRTLTTNYLDPE